MSQYIGSVTAIVTRSQLGYVGTLTEINAAAATLTLRNVNALGTEGRRGGGEDEVPRQPGMYESITFRSTEIAELKVVEMSSTAATDVAALDPAVATATVEPAAPAPAPASTSAPAPAPARAGARVARAPAEARGGRSAESRGTHGPAGDAGSAGAEEEEEDEADPTAGFIPGTGAYAAHARIRGGGGRKGGRKGGGAGAAAPAEFDIQSSTSKFDKEAEKAAAAEAGDGDADGAAAAKSAYQKGSFFDTLSTGPRASDERGEWVAQERARNNETFGAEGLSTTYGERYAARTRGGHSGYGGDRPPRREERDRDGEHWRGGGRGGGRGWAKGSGSWHRS